MTSTNRKTPATGIGAATDQPLSSPTGVPSAATRPGEAVRRQRGWATRLTPWGLMTPALVVLLLMTIAPAIYLVWSSLRSSTLLGAGGSFVGLQNYKDALTDPTVLHSLFITAGFVLVAVTVEMVLGLLLALPLAAQSRSNNVAATLMLLPFAVTPAVSAMMFKELLNPNYGWVDHYLGVLGFPAHIDWLGNSTTAWLALIGLDVWQWTPFVALILMGGLQSLPKEPLEAAAIDGASTWQTFRHVILPLLAPFLAIALTLRTIQAFKTFDAFKILTGGGPGDSTEIINLGIYRVALQSFRIGAASALAMVLLILLSLLVPLLLRAVGRNAEPTEA
jgi:multiple sugar transport system permease protein